MDNSIVIMLLTVFILNWQQFMPSPFLAQYTIDVKGLTQGETGLIFSASPLLSIFLSLLAGKYMYLFEKKKLVILAVLIAASGSLTFQSIKYLTDTTLIFLVALLGRFFEGMGNSIALPCLYSMLPVIYPTTVETKIGYMESACAIGQVIAPVVGSFLYSYGGLQCPYLCVVSLLILLVVPLSRLPKIQAQAKKSIPLGKAMSTQVLGLIFMSTSVQIGLYIFESTLSQRLASFGESQNTIGVFFMYLSLSYLLGIGLYEYLKMFLDREVSIFFGILMVSFGLFLLGPDQTLFNFPQKSYMIASGLIMQGFAGAFIYIGFMPVLSKKISRTGDYQRSQVNDLSSSFFITTLFMGAAIGPYLGSVLTETYSFQTSTSSVGYFLFGFAFVYLFFLTDLFNKEKIMSSHGKNLEDSLIESEEEFDSDEEEGNGKLSNDQENARHILVFKIIFE